MSNAEKLFLQHQSIADNYARKVFNAGYLGFDQEDVIQEFKLKLYETILSYEKSIVRREQRGMIRPVPLPIYIKSAMSNYVKDFIKKINLQQSAFQMSSLESEKDFATYSNDTSEIDVDTNTFILNGFDITANLQGFSKIAFNMYLKGRSAEEVDRIFGARINVKKVISNQKKFLADNYEHFKMENKQEFFVNHLIED